MANAEINENGVLCNYRQPCEYPYTEQPGSANQTMLVIENHHTPNSTLNSNDPCFGWIDIYIKKPDGSQSLIHHIAQRTVEACIFDKVKVTRNNTGKIVKIDFGLSYPRIFSSNNTSLECRHEIIEFTDKTLSSRDPNLCPRPQKTPQIATVITSQRTRR